MPMDKWDPVDDLIKLRNRFNDLFDRSFRDQLPGSGVGRAYWAPPVDFFETEDGLVLEAELPGMDRQDIDIEVNSGQLVIRGERSTPFQMEQAAFHRVERQHGPFKRIVDLPASVDPTRIEATYESGLLCIVIPFLEPKGRKIEVQTK